MHTFTRDPARPQPSFIEWVPAVSVSRRVAPLLKRLVTAHGGSVRLDERGDIVGIITTRAALEEMRREAERRAEAGQS